MYTPSLQTKSHEPLIVGAAYTGIKSNKLNAFRPFSHFTGLYAGGEWVEQGGEKMVFLHTFVAGPHTWDISDDTEQWELQPAPDEVLN